LSHIDRMPLGDLADTFLSLLVAHPEIHWIFSYRVIPIQNIQDSFMIAIDSDPIVTDPIREFYLDDQPIKETLEGIPLCDPTVLAYLREVFQDGIRSVM
jgi:hypothetical protein